MKHINYIKIKELQKKIGYIFKKTNYLIQALTHCSVGKNNNERFEFLGDSILNYIITNIIFNKFPYNNEGDMSKMRSTLVNSNTLKEIANEFNLSKYLNLGIGELKNKGIYKKSILANTVEAIIGGIFLDSNIKTIEKIILNWYKNKFNFLNFNNKQKDYKTKLQEYLQAKILPLPIYSIIQIYGNAHNQKFITQCKINIITKKTTGISSSRRKSEQIAAKNMLKLLINIK